MGEKESMGRGRGGGRGTEGETEGGRLHIPTYFKIMLQ